MVGPILGADKGARVVDRRQADQLSTRRSLLIVVRFQHSHHAAMSSFGNVEIKALWQIRICRVVLDLTCATSTRAQSGLADMLMRMSIPACGLSRLRCFAGGIG